MQHHSVMVRAEWDAEAGVYVATSEDVPGLATEAASLEELTSKLQVMIPELLELNGAAATRFDEVPLYVMAQHVSRIRVPA